VNNAGTHNMGPFASLSPDDFRGQLEVHFFGTLLMTRAAWPHFVRARYGRIVNAIAPRAFTRMSAFAFAAQPEEAKQQAAVMLEPGLNAPGAVYLAHEACTLNGEVLRTGMNSVGRLAVVHTDGVAEAALTPEDIAANLDTVLDVTHGAVVDPL
jgi:NAD(P)-dependent dehydrogenase (short-subunit alcohol dehydrogenase family)